MFILAAIAELSFLGWLAFAVGTVAVFGSIFTFKTSRPASGVWTLAALAGFIAAFHSGLFDYSKQHFITVTDNSFDWGAAGWALIKFLACWFVGSVVTAFLFWVSFVRDVKLRFVENLERLTDRFKYSSTYNAWTERAKDVVVKVMALGHRGDNVFLDSSFKLSLPDSFPDTMRDSWELQLTKTAEGSIHEEQLIILEAAVSKFLPPRIKHHKLAVTYAATVWPVTLLSLLLSDLVRHVWEYLLTFWHRALDAVSKKVFGDVGLPAKS